MQPADPPTIEARRRSPWNILIGLLVIVEIFAGVILMVTVPVWMAPPNAASTISLYIALLFLWIPLLIVLAAFGYRGPFVLFIVIGVIAVVIGLAVGGPNLNKGAIQAKDCTSQEISLGQTEYTCKLTNSFGVATSMETIVFQGQTGSSYVRLISDTTIFAP